MPTLLRYEFIQYHRPMEKRLACHWCSATPDMLFAYVWSDDPRPHGNPAQLPGFCQPACYSAYIELRNAKEH